MRNGGAFSVKCHILGGANGRERSMMVVPRVLVACAVVGLLQVSLAHAEDALDLTGSWKGSMQCSKFLDKTHRVGQESDLEILQMGNEVFMSFDGGPLFHGVVFTEADHPQKGAVAFTECTTSGALTGSNTLGQARVITGRSGRFVATFVHAEGSGATLPASWVETCRVAFDRMDTTAPALATSCPPPPP